MSSIVIVVRREDLFIEKMDDKILAARMIEFVVGVKSVFAEYVTDYYDVSYKNAMDILRIKQTPETFEIGIESPEMYDGKLKKVVANILKHDLGSVTDHIRPLHYLKNISEDITQSIRTMWIGFMVRRDGGDTYRSR